MNKGIDILIDALIADFTSYLWTGNVNQFYGRIFRNELNGKIYPLYYLGSEGIDVLKDDRKDSQCFVEVMPTRKMFADIIEAECRVYFMVNLSMIYPLLSRTDSIEEVMRDVKDIIFNSEFNFVQLVSGVEAFKDFPDDAISDLSGQHLFRYDVRCNYIND